MRYNPLRSSYRRPLRLFVVTPLLALSLAACVVPTPMTNQSPTANQPAASQEQAAAPTAKLNINTAAETDLLKIPGVGENMVKEILEYRPFTNLEHFRKEIGKYVDAAQLVEYEKYLFVPVDINNATEAELLTIPGVGDQMVDEILEYRPFTNLEHFRKEIGKYVDAAQLVEYEKYIVINHN